MDKHYGQIVEHIVRKNGYSITELAEGLNLNRRTLYNYFQNKYLKYDVIYKIGLIVRHDFSKEFPELFTTEQFDLRNALSTNINLSFNADINENHWKDKYIQLLEMYNSVLTDRVLNKDSVQILEARS